MYEAILALHLDIAAIEFVHHHYVRFSFLRVEAASNSRKPFFVHVFNAGMLFHPLAKRCKLGKGTCNLIKLPRVCEQKLLKKPFLNVFKCFYTASLNQYLFTIFFKQYPASLCRSVIQKPVKGESLGEEQNP